MEIHPAIDRRKVYGASMKERTAKLWAKQDQHEGDRLRLFTAASKAVDASSVLYPGCFVDIAPSFVFPTVTHVDMDRRANQFFQDADGVNEIIATNQIDQGERTVRWLAQDYRDDLDLPEQSVDLLCSLYAGFISEHCTGHLRIGGRLLVNASHGDVAMASIDLRYRLDAAVESRDGDYRVHRRDLDRYLVPKKPQTITVASLHQLGRGIAYTKSPFAYLFERIS